MGVPDECFVGPDGRRLPFRVEQRPGLGRCVVAARDIEPTELIISERAAAVGPVQVHTRPKWSVNLWANGRLKCLREAHAQFKLHSSHID